MGTTIELEIFTMTALIITEKHKTALPFAKLLHCDVEHTHYDNGMTGYLESSDGQYIVSWCAGHLISTLMPDEYDARYRRWDMNDLPIVPSVWKYKPATRNPAKAQLKIIKELLKRSDIDVIYHACDADREGNLILDEVFRYLKLDPSTMKCYRVWYTSTTQDSISQALKNAKPLSQYKGLSDAADCRQKLDWLFGINMTRAFTCYARSLQNVGRVVSPTIGLIVQRQKEIDGFIPTDYALVSASLDNRSGNNPKRFTVTTRIADISKAQALSKSIIGKPAVITSVDEREASETRKLFNTTGLQSEASKRFGLEPSETMRIMQSLYDNGFISYPRTKSCLITKDMIHDTVPLIEKSFNTVFDKQDFRNLYDASNADVARIVSDTSKAKNAEEASHTGLLPTSHGLDAFKSLSSDKEKNIFLLIAQRFLCSVYLPKRMKKTKVKVEIENEEFTANGNVVLDEGFSSFESKALGCLSVSSKKSGNSKRGLPHDNEDGSEVPQFLPELGAGESFDCIGASFKKKQTTPPQQYTTAQLLSAMENISRIVDDKKLKSLLKDSGLGTAASRDTIIKTINDNGYVERKSGRLYPTLKAIALIGMLPKDITSPIMTGKMEVALDDIANGTRSEEDVLHDVNKRIVYELNQIAKLPVIKDTEKYKHNRVFLPHGCPRCGADVVETSKSVVCKDDCGFIIRNTIAKRKIPKTEIKALLQQGHSKNKIKGFKSKKGNDFSCWLYLDKDFKTQFDFDEHGNKAKKENCFESSK